MYNNSFGPGYRPGNNYAQRLNALEQQYYQQQPWQGQPIQNLNQTIQPQASCYFVSSPEELNGVGITPNNFFLGINQGKKEIYIRKMDNNGITQLETYTLSANVEQKDEYRLILEQLTAINEKLSPKREETGNESRTINSNGNAGKNEYVPAGGSNDARKTSRSSGNEPF